MAWAAGLAADHALGETIPMRLKVLHYVAKYMELTETEPEQK